MTALSLLRHVNAETDLRSQPCAMHYLRTKDGKEVDCRLVQDNR